MDDRAGGTRQADQVCERLARRADECRVVDIRNGTVEPLVMRVVDLPVPFFSVHDLSVKSRPCLHIAHGIKKWASWKYGNLNRVISKSKRMTANRDKSVVSSV